MASSTVFTYNSAFADAKCALQDVHDYLFQVVQNLLLRPEESTGVLGPVPLAEPTDSQAPWYGMHEAAVQRAGSGESPSALPDSLAGPTERRARSPGFFQQQFETVVAARLQLQALYEERTSVDAVMEGTWDSLSSLLDTVGEKLQSFHHAPETTHALEQVVEALGDVLTSLYSQADIVVTDVGASPSAQAAQRAPASPSSFGQLPGAWLLGSFLRRSSSPAHGSDAEVPERRAASFSSHVNGFECPSDWLLQQDTLQEPVQSTPPPSKADDCRELRAVLLDRSAPAERRLEAASDLEALITNPDCLAALREKDGLMRMMRACSESPARADPAAGQPARVALRDLSLNVALSALRSPSQEFSPDEVTMLMHLVVQQLCEALPKRMDSPKAAAGLLSPTRASAASRAPPPQPLLISSDAAGAEPGSEAVASAVGCDARRVAQAVRVASVLVLDTCSVQPSLLDTTRSQIQSMAKLLLEVFGNPFEFPPLPLPPSTPVCTAATALTACATAEHLSPASVPGTSSRAGSSASLGTAPALELEAASSRASVRAPSSRSTHSTCSLPAPLAPLSPASSESAEAVGMGERRARAVSAAAVSHAVWQARELDWRTARSEAGDALLTLLQLQGMSEWYIENRVALACVDVLGQERTPTEHAAAWRLLLKLLGEIGRAHDDSAAWFASCKPVLEQGALQHVVTWLQEHAKDGPVHARELREQLSMVAGPVQVLHALCGFSMHRVSTAGGDKLEDSRSYKQLCTVESKVDQLLAFAQERSHVAAQLCTALGSLTKFVTACHRAVFEQHALFPHPAFHVSAAKFPPEAVGSGDVEIALPWLLQSWRDATFSLVAHPTLLAGTQLVGLLWGASCKRQDRFPALCSALQRHHSAAMSWLLLALEVPAYEVHLAAVFAARGLLHAFHDEAVARPDAFLALLVRLVFHMQRHAVDYVIDRNVRDADEVALHWSLPWLPAPPCAGACDSLLVCPAQQCTLLWTPMAASVCPLADAAALPPVHADALLRQALQGCLAGPGLLGRAGFAAASPLLTPSSRSAASPPGAAEDALLLDSPTSSSLLHEFALPRDSFKAVLVDLLHSFGHCWGEAQESSVLPLREQAVGLLMWMLQLQPLPIRREASKLLVRLAPALQAGQHALAGSAWRRLAALQSAACGNMLQAVDAPGGSPGLVGQLRRTLSSMCHRQGRDLFGEGWQPEWLGILPMAMTIELAAATLQHQPQQQQHRHVLASLLQRCAPHGTPWQAVLAAGIDSWPLWYATNGLRGELGPVFAALSAWCMQPQLARATPLGGLGALPVAQLKQVQEFVAAQMTPLSQVGSQDTAHAHSAAVHYLLQKHPELAACYDSAPLWPTSPGIAQVLLLHALCIAGNATRCLEQLKTWQLQQDRLQPGLPDFVWEGCLAAIPANSACSAEVVPAPVLHRARILFEALVSADELQVADWCMLLQAPYESGRSIDPLAAALQELERSQPATRAVMLAMLALLTAQAVEERLAAASDAYKKVVQLPLPSLLPLWCLPTATSHLMNQVCRVSFAHALLAWYSGFELRSNAYTVWLHWRGLCARLARLGPEDMAAAAMPSCCERSWDRKLRRSPELPQQWAELASAQASACMLRRSPALRTACLVLHAGSAPMFSLLCEALAAQPQSADSSADSRSANYFRSLLLMARHELGVRACIVNASSLATVRSVASEDVAGIIVPGCAWRGDSAGPLSVGHGRPSAAAQPAKLKDVSGHQSHDVPALDDALVRGPITPRALGLTLAGEQAVCSVCDELRGSIAAGWRLAASSVEGVHGVEALLLSCAGRGLAERDYTALQSVLGLQVVLELPATGRVLPRLAVPVCGNAVSFMGLTAIQLEDVSLDSKQLSRLLASFCSAACLQSLTLRSVGTLASEHVDVLLKLVRSSRVQLRWLTIDTPHRAAVTAQLLHGVTECTPRSLSVRMHPCWKEVHRRLCEGRARLPDEEVVAALQALAESIVAEAGLGPEQAHELVQEGFQLLGDAESPTHAGGSSVMDSASSCLQALCLAGLRCSGQPHEFWQLLQAGKRAIDQAYLGELDLRGYRCLPSELVEEWAAAAVERSVMPRPSQWFPPIIVRLPLRHLRMGAVWGAAACASDFFHNFVLSVQPYLAAPVAMPVNQQAGFQPALRAASRRASSAAASSSPGLSGWAAFQVPRTVVLGLALPLAWKTEDDRLSPLDKFSVHDELRVVELLNYEVHPVFLTAARLHAALSCGADVLHIAAHGTHVSTLGTAALALESDHDSYATVYTTNNLRHSLAKLGEAARLPRVVVLAACSVSEMQDALLEAGVEHVICSAGVLKDLASTTFLSTFYRELGAGKDVADAFSMAERAVSLSQPPFTHKCRADLSSPASREPAPPATIPEFFSHNTDTVQLILPQTGDAPQQRVRCKPDVAGKTTAAGPVALRSLTHNLPQPPTYAVGRVSVQFASLRRLVYEAQEEQKSLVTITGESGSGTTTEALRIAQYCARRCLFAHGVVYISLKAPHASAFSSQYAEYAPAGTRTMSLHGEAAANDSLDLPWARSWVRAIIGKHVSVSDAAVVAAPAPAADLPEDAGAGASEQRGYSGRKVASGFKLPGRELASLELPLAHVQDALVACLREQHMLVVVDGGEEVAWVRSLVWRLTVECQRLRCVWARHQGPSPEELEADPESAKHFNVQLAALKAQQAKKLLLHALDKHLSQEELSTIADIQQLMGPQQLLPGLVQLRARSLLEQFNLSRRREERRSSNVQSDNIPPLAALVASAPPPDVASTTQRSAATEASIQPAAAALPRT